MSTSTLPEGQKLAGISPRAFEHPADRAATAALGRIPLLNTVVAKLIELGYVNAMRQNLRAGAIKLGPTQLGNAWADHSAAYARLDMDPVPNLYVTQFPMVNAMAVGAGKPLVVVNSATVELLDREELRAVLAHEAGHILAEHVTYQSALAVLLSLGGGPLGALGSLPLKGIQLALMEWYRAAELSADRAAALVVRDPLVVCRLLMVVSAGVPSERLDLAAFIEQGRQYRDAEGWNRLSRLRTELNQTHPYAVKRVHELMKWVQSGEYDRIIGGEYVKRGNEAHWREETDAATEHYTERFRGMMDDAAQGVSKLGEQVGEATGKASEAASEAAEKLQGWLRRDRDQQG